METHSIPLVTENNLESISYYKDRHDIVFLGSVLVFIVVLLYSVVVLNWSIIEIDNSIQSNALLFLSENFRWLIVCLFVLILVLSHLGNREKPFKIQDIEFYNPTSRKSLNTLIISTFFFVLLVGLPIWSLGGSINSCFGSMLITMCGLIVVVSNSKSVRLGFIIVCILIYGLGSFFYVPIKIKDNFYYTVLYNVVMLLTICITLVLTWKGKTIFEIRSPN